MAENNVTHPKFLAYVNTLNPLHPRVTAYIDGYTRGEKQEHLNDPRLPNHNFQDLGLFASLLGYANRGEDHFRTSPGRGAFIRAYCAGATGKPAEVLCTKCGFIFAEGMTYRTMPEPLCGDCCELEGTLL